MADESTVTIPEPTAEAPSFDMDAAVEKISEGLFPEHEAAEPSPKETVTEAVTEQAAPPTKTVPPIATVRQAPKSWAKDVHPVWEKIDPKGQEYIEKREKDFLDGLEQYKGAANYAQSIQKVLDPYQPLLHSKGLDAPTVINDLMGTYTRLTSGTMEQRQQALLQVAKNLAITLPASNGSTPETATPIDPRIQTLEQQFEMVQQTLVAQQQAALTAAKQKASAEVEAFASELNKDGTPKNAFFDECHEDIVKFIKAGESLQDAYDKAVWANPVTREKQKQAYFQTESEKAKERARLDALPKQKAKSVNVKSQDTQRPPTDPLGSMDQTLRSTYKDIKDRETVH